MEPGINKPEAFAEEIKAKYADSEHQMVADKLSVTTSLQSAMVIMDYHIISTVALIFKPPL